MKILITGGTGFIGQRLCQQLLADHHELTVLSRSAKTQPELNMVQSLGALPVTETFDAVINLAGEPIADKRWSDGQKNKIVASRIETTEAVLAFISKAETKPRVLINGSAIGFYGTGISDHEITEAGDFDESFSSQLCQVWEAAARQAETLGVRTCLLRIGIVLGHGGALGKMLLPFKLGLGGKIGSGKQWMPWIHMDDMVTIILRCLDDEAMSGAVNCTAPNPVRNETFTKALGNALGRPAFMPMPGFAVSLLMGEMGEELLLAGKKVVPAKLHAANFEFRYDDINEALRDVVTS